MKIGVAGRINDWLNKTPESKTPGGRPAVGRLHDNHLLYSVFVLFAPLYLILYLSFIEMNNVFFKGDSEQTLIMKHTICAATTQCCSCT